MPRVTLFTPELSHAIETIAYFLKMGGAQVRVATSPDGDEMSEHPRSLRRIQQYGGIEVSDYVGEPQSSDILVFVLVQYGRISDKFRQWRKRARSLAVVPSREGRMTQREWARELVRSFPHYFGARRISFFPYVHPQLLLHPQWRERLLGSFDEKAERKHRICFVGCTQPPERGVRLEQCRRALAGAEKQTYWLDYGGVELKDRRSLDPMQYLDVLSNTDFCISPPGWGAIYTHRTIEAIIRGAIPIIEDPERYELEFCDHENCIIAAATDWGAAVRAALDVSQPEVQRMRRNVLALRADRLLPQKAIDRFNSQLLA